MEADNNTIDSTVPSNLNLNKQVEIEKNYNPSGKKTFSGFKKNNQKNYLRSQFSYYNKDGKFLTNYNNLNRATLRIRSISSPTTIIQGGNIYLYQISYFSRS